MSSLSKPANLKIALISGVALVVLALLIEQVSCRRPKDIERVAHADPELQAASKKAQEGLDGFIKELQSPKAGDQFAVKGGFKTPAGPEYLWVRSPSYKDGVFTGKLDQVPMVYGKKKGDEVTVPRKDVYDWLIKNGDDIQGQFTDKVLESREGRR